MLGFKNFLMEEDGVGVVEMVHSRYLQLHL